MKLNLPPSYLLIHRVWLGGLAVLSQLNARAAFGGVLEEFLPGYAASSRERTADSRVRRLRPVADGRRAGRRERGALDLEHRSGRRTDDVLCHDAPGARPKHRGQARCRLVVRAGAGPSGNANTACIINARHSDKAGSQARSWPGKPGVPRSTRRGALRLCRVLMMQAEMMVSRTHGSHG